MTRMVTATRQCARARASTVFSAIKLAAVSPQLEVESTGIVWRRGLVDSACVNNLDCRRPSIRPLARAVQRGAASVMSTKPSYLSRPATQPLLGETIGGCLDRIVALYGDHEALVSRHQGKRLTYRQLDAEARRLARGLLALGLQKGERVALWSANTAEWLITQYAVARSGGILVSVNPAYRLREIEYALNLAGVTTLIAAPQFRETDHVALL